MSFKGKIVIIDKTKEKTKENFFCKICSYVLHSKEDFKASKKYNSCHECYLTFIQGQDKYWNENCQPNDQKLREYLKDKNKR